jgi:hypothetical protein
LDEVQRDTAELLPNGEWRRYEEAKIDFKEEAMLDGDDDVLVLLAVNKKRRQGKKRKFSAAAVAGEDSEDDDGIFLFH